jgi:hypothetical protein
MGRQTHRKYVAGSRHLIRSSSAPRATIRMYFFFNLLVNAFSISRQHCWSHPPIARNFIFALYYLPVYPFLLHLDPTTVPNASPKATLTHTNLPLLEGKSARGGKGATTPKRVDLLLNWPVACDERRGPMITLAAKQFTTTLSGEDLTLSLDSDILHPIISKAPSAAGPEAVSRN